MNVSVAIEGMHLGWGKIDVKNIEIGNPPNSILSKAFSCHEIDVNAPFTRYLNKHIIIDEIDLNDVYLGLEFDSAASTKGNWTTIMSNIENQLLTRKKRRVLLKEQDDQSSFIVLSSQISTSMSFIKKMAGKLKNYRPSLEWSLLKLAVKADFPWIRSPTLCSAKCSSKFSLKKTSKTCFKS